jgi:hypothetical protein
VRQLPMSLLCIPGVLKRVVCIILQFTVPCCPSLPFLFNIKSCIYKKLTNLHTSTLKMEAMGISVSPVTSPTFTRLQKKIGLLSSTTNCKTSVEMRTSPDINVDG